MKKIKVLHVFGIMNRGGAELRTLELLSCLDPNAYEHHFLVLSGSKGVLDDDIKEKGYEIHYLKLKSLNFIFGILKLLVLEKYDVVHSNVLYFSGLIQFLARIAGVKGRISHIRSTGDGKGDDPFRVQYRKIMKHLLVRHSTKIAGVSRSVLEAHFKEELSNDKDKFVVMYNGFDLNRFSRPSASRVRKTLGIPGDATVFIHIGRFDAAKNHTKVISVFREAANRDSNAYLLLVGKNDTEGGEEILHSIRNFGLSEKVHVLGVRSDIEVILGESDCLIFPSIREGLPGVLLEACLSGTPAVASKIPSNIEVSEFFPIVKLIELDEDDEEWAEMCFQVIRLAVTENFKKNKRLYEGSSPFDMDQAVRNYTDLLD